MHAADRETTRLAMARSALYLLRLSEVIKRVGLGRSSVYARLDCDSKYYDPTFPRPVSLSPVGRGTVAWVEDEIDTWIRQQISKSRNSDTQDQSSRIHSD
ncbi:helix-turn-helix transcriptional regulator [Azospira oryzae]